MMSPTGDRHGAIELNLAAALKVYADTQRRGKVRSGEVGIYVRRNPDTVRAADVLYISNERYEKRQSTGFLDVAPELVVEVLSPEDRWSEVMRELGEYFEAGVLRVWVVDGSLGSIFAYRSLTEVTRYSKDATLTDEEILPGFSAPVAEVFRE
jgi:Uma2 family endonuclease